MGAGLSRNRSLDESCADWALFLDDDVRPSRNLLHVYGKAIMEHTPDPLRADGSEDRNNEPVTCGFIGKTAFPPAATSLQRAVVVSGLTFMYGVSGVVERPAWGVTANLLVKVGCAGGRRAITTFGGEFPKTGGGEDVDFCLRCVFKPGCAKQSIPTHMWRRMLSSSICVLRATFVPDGRLLILYVRPQVESCGSGADLSVLKTYIAYASLVP